MITPALNDGARSDVLQDIGEASARRAGPICLHAAMSLCRQLGERRFELGRFAAWRDEKSASITHYEAQFGGAVNRVPNLHLRPADRTGVIRRVGGGVRKMLAAQLAVPDALRRLRTPVPR